jgi:hypothetical protein
MDAGDSAVPRPVPDPPAGGWSPLQAIASAEGLAGCYLELQRRRGAV